MERRANNITINNLDNVYGAGIMANYCQRSFGIFDEYRLRGRQMTVNIQIKSTACWLLPSPLLLGPAQPLS